MADGSWYDADIDRVIISEEQIREKIDELAKQVAADYAGVDDGLLLVCVLKGAVMFMADFARALGRHGPPAELEFMAVSSYGQGTTSSGRGAHPQGPRPRHRRPARDRGRGHRRLRSDAVLAAEVPGSPGRRRASRWWRCSASRTRSRCTSPVRYVGFDIPNEFVVGYGLDYAERYRELPYVGVLKPAVYARS